MFNEYAKRIREAEVNDFIVSEIIEEAAYDDTLTDDEYTALYEMAIAKLR